MVTSPQNLIIFQVVLHYYYKQTVSC